MNPRLAQFGIIGLSALFMVGIGLFTFQSLNTISQSSVLGATPEPQDSEEPQTLLSYEVRMQKAKLYFEEGFYFEAATEYAYASQIENEIPAPYLGLARAYWALHDTEKAELNAKAAYELEAANEGLAEQETLAFYAHTLLGKGKIDEASTLLATVLDPTQEVLYVQGLLAVTQEQDSKHFFERALAQSGTVTPSHLQGFISAHQAYENAQGSDSSYLNALLSKALLDADESILAAELALRTLKIKSDYRDLWMVLGYAQLELEQFAEAEDSFKAAKKIDSIKPEIHYLLGTAHFMQKEYKESIDEMELALLYDFEPAAEAYKKIAESHGFLGQPNEALAAYEAMLNLSPSNIFLFEAPIRTALEELGDLSRAETLAQKAVALFPEEGLGHTFLAKIYFKKGEIEFASTSIQNALRLDAQNPDVHLTAGLILEGENETGKAQSEYKKAFELSSTGEAVNRAAAEAYNRLMTTLSQ